MLFNPSDTYYLYKRFDINNWHQVIILLKLYYLIQLLKLILITGIKL